MPVPLYLFTGPETGELEDTVKKHREAIVSQFGEVEFYTFYPQETSVPTIISVLENESLFSPARFIRVHNAELIKKKEDIALISQWTTLVANTQKDAHAWLVLTSAETSIDKKLDALVPKQNKKIFWELFENQKIQWVKNWFSQKGFTIDSDAVSAILELVQNNTQSLRDECERFLLFFEANHVVTREDVEKIITHNREETAFSLFKSMCRNDRSSKENFETALSVLDKIRRSKESSSVQLIAGLSYCFRRLFDWHQLHALGRPDDFKLKTAGFGSKLLQTQYKNAAMIWSEKDTSTCIALLAWTDKTIRERGMATESLYLQMLLYCLIIKRGEALEHCAISDF